MITLREKRVAFTQAVAKLVQYADSIGIEVALGPDGLRHMENSLHYIGLAVDLNAYRDGVYLTATGDYQALGEYWETLHPLAKWGGRFRDGNHFSFEHGGRK